MLSDQAKAELKKRMIQQKAEALLFQGVFGSPDGKLVLRKLSKMGKENEPTYVDQNPNGTAYHEGQRSIIIGIRKMLNKTFEEYQGNVKIKEKE